MKKWLVVLITGFVVTTLWSQKVQMTLQEAVTYALDNNVEAQKALMEIEKAKEKVWETTSTGLPQVSGNIDYNNYIKQPVSLIPAEVFGGNPGDFAEVVFGTKHNVVAGIQVNQLLFSGSYLVGLQSAKAYEKISELVKEKTDIQLKEAVINLYVTVIIADENIDIASQNLSVSDKLLYDITQIYKEGLGEFQTVEQAEYNNLSLKYNLENLERSREIVLNSLKLLLNLDEELELELTTDKDQLLFETQTLLSDSVELDVENHIDYRIIQNEELTKKLQTKYEKSRGLPTVSAFFNSSYNAFNNKFDFFGDKWFNTTLWGVGIDIPIFTGLGKNSRVQQAKIEWEQTQLDVKNTEKTLKNNARESYIQYQNALNTVENTQKLIDLSESIYKKTNIKYFEGLATSQELSTAEIQKWDAQQKYIQALYSAIQAKVTLDKNLGVL